jgi:hypothetical protein
MDDRYQPVAIPPDIENHIAIYRIRVAKHLPHVHEARPPNRFGNFVPCGDLFRRVRMFGRRFAQMPERDHMHKFSIFSF